LLSDHDEIALIRGLRSGSRTAWTSLYENYSADVWRYVARLIGPDTAAVADVVQEAFLAAARTAARFDPDRGTLWTWLTGIAHHQVAAHWRQASKAARLKSLAEQGAVEIRQWLDSVAPLEEAWERRELADLVRGILAELPAEHAALLTAKYIDDGSLEDLAARFGTTVEAAKSKLARARKEFRNKFERLTREPTSPAGKQR
jgi:RNA polymerase sigma-70 factor (ECF subfamily)